MALPFDIPDAWWHAWDQVWHLGVAFLLALPIGWDRERRDYSAPPVPPQET
ncbi:MAG: MgtC/SapB family protein [Planctomycetaceae bacterium]|nr:MgtC/SapB family protein [Planctomycetaceae bacterium]